MKVLTKNSKAFHDYTIVERFEAGIELRGTEVKSCRSSQIALLDAYAKVIDGELWLLGAHIAPYAQGNQFNHDPKRNRRLLMHRKEIRRLQQAVEAKGMTLIPLTVGLSRGRVKIELGLCRGKAQYDKRQALRRKEHERETRQALRQR
ncbi:MAG: SsrA-binding protein [Lentisphaerae bacterium ADurb.BinA184]|nr:MAG: SsrA-binding protein [Lentisphaerae bacterium ADurb.BinA184]